MSGTIATKPARLVAAGEPVELIGPPMPYVGRGGVKLAAALDAFDLSVEGVRCLDAGSSTGGFTDALLQAGAARVIAVDVGRNQLHERLRADPRVDSREQTDIRDLDPASIGGVVNIVVADLSFISVERVIDSLMNLLEPGGDLVVLVKPQFEAGRAEVSRGRGVVRDPDIWRDVLMSAVSAIRDAGAAIMEAMVSPLRGADGNTEFLVHARKAPAQSKSTTQPTPAEALDIDALVAAAQEETER